jgi:hypothetical protein
MSVCTTSRECTSNTTSAPETFTLLKIHKKMYERYQTRKRVIEEQPTMTGYNEDETCKYVLSVSAWPCFSKQVFLSFSFYLTYKTGVTSKLHLAAIRLGY